ncbi:hypothetical protein NQ317_009118 [Molorchus minor]|uniref:Uncharacterized protein n=1 Tax=Molorchus minor TaxID=1323400 RepID=A0ABQ9JJU9_9CUCU|nr:hypothetical protein NQ317_009118 [Molorchus minor]
MIFEFTFQILIFSLALFTLSECEEKKIPRKRRGSFQTAYPGGNNQLQIGGVNVDTFGRTNIPLQQMDLFAPSVDLTGANPNGTPQLYQVPQVNYITSNAIDKPVQEAQEYVPPQSIGTAIIPQVPPPATPVNLVASNGPANGGAVFLGSGALGVIDLGGGNNQNTSSSPVRAAPNLIPAAVPSPQPQQTPVINFNNAYLGGQPPIRDRNGYEYLRPDKIGFGNPLPPRPLKTTMAFATPSAQQIQPQVTPYQPVAPTGFGQNDPGIISTGAFYR